MIIENSNNNNVFIKKIGIGISAYLVYIIVVLMLEVFKVFTLFSDPSFVVDLVGIGIGAYAAYGIMKVDYSSRLPLVLLLMIAAFSITGMVDFILETTQPNLRNVNPWEEAFKASGVLFLVLLGSLLGKRSSEKKES